MKLTRIDVRFYKSFNFDFELKARPSADREAWEDQDGPWYPFVRIPLDADVTAIVGANESGKSHLLGAIKAALGIDGIDRADFCRYSAQYSVQVS